MSKKRKPRSPRKGPSAEIPMRMVRAHQKELLDLLAPVDQLVKELRAKDRMRLDGILDGVGILALSDAVTEFIRALVSTETATSIADRTVGRINRFGRVSFRSWASALGLDPDKVDEDAEDSLSGTIQERATAHAQLIESITQQLADQVGELMTQAALSGTRPSELADILEDRLGVAKSRARLIARDQMGTIQSTIARARQENLGVTRYEWKTSEDERVRPSHQALNGQVFSWDAPPSEGHPGEAINCRCVALPVFDD